MAKKVEQSFRDSCHYGNVVISINIDYPELTPCDCSICLERPDISDVPVRATDGIGMP